jgi:FlgD Ig-like domain
MDGLLKRSFLLVISVSCLVGTTNEGHAVDIRKARSTPIPRDIRDRTLVSTSSYSVLSKAPTDTFYLYGGPGTNEGKFQAVVGPIAERQGWIGVDLTDKPVYWQVSTFNAENLGGHGPGNNAAWSGQTTVQQPNWISAPGYGDSWNDRLLFRSGPLADPSMGQTVNLDFVFNYNTEVGYDFFSVEVDSAGTWITLYSTSGTNALGGVFANPGVQYSTVATRSISYAGGDYGGANGDEVVIRLRFTSDAGWSDQDGLWPSFGAVQIDDISVTWSDGSDFEDFESGSFDGQWRGWRTLFAGDFSQVWPLFQEGGLDPCRENNTPVMAFVDAGQEVGNAASSAQIPGYATSTGGITSIIWSYGVPGAWVVNFDGGLSLRPVRRDRVPLYNEVWSPPIDWDLPGSDDDAIDITGARFRFSVWAHLPLFNGMFFVWHVRTSADGVVWGDWVDRNFIYYGGGIAAWASVEFDITDLLSSRPRKVQLALGVIDYSDLFFGGDATPSPVFDDIAFMKYRIGGPVISASEANLANDGFPVSGSIDASTASSRDALDIPFDMARDIATEKDLRIDAGDSIVVDTVAQIPGTTLSDIRMVWVLDRNPLFEDAIRSVPARATDENVVIGPTQWSGEVLGDSALTSAGIAVPDRYYFDLPDQDLIYPGDVLRYYIRATDSEGRVTTLPEETTGFVSGAGYDRTFTMHALPSLLDASGSQPPKLVLNDFGHRGEEDELYGAFDQLGLIRGTDFDVYTTQSPVSGISNSIGSTGHHGASAGQLSGYDTIVYLTGNLSSGGLSDGSGIGQNDKSDDLGVLTTWHSLSGARNVVYFGDYVASILSDYGSAGATFRQTIMNVGLNDYDVRDEINTQTTPTVRPLGVNFATQFVAYGGCPGVNQFDSIRALPGATRGHGFVDLTGGIYPDIAASVIHDRIINGDRKIDMTIPFAFMFVRDNVSKTVGSTSVRAELMREIFSFFGVPSGDPGSATVAPSTAAPSMSVFPNPFNPRTVVRFIGLAATATGSVRIYNTRGELVATLHDGEFTRSEFVWDGTDSNGRSVASGVYMIEGQADGFRQVEKVAVLK